MKRIKISNYTLHSNRVDVFLTNGQCLTLFFTEQSGTAFFRYKINTISKIKHPGIFIGVDSTGVQYFIHNHYQIGTTVLCNRQEFDKGRPLYIYDEDRTNDSMTIIKKAFESLMKGERYHFYKNNCQTMVNDSYSNQRRSRAVENWTIAVVLIIIFGFLFSLAGGGSKRSMS